MGTKQKNKLVESLEYFGFRAAVGTIRLLPVPVAYAAARTVAAILYRVDSKHRKRIQKHLLHSGICTTESEAKEITKKNFAHMVKLFIEIVKFDQVITRENIHEHVTIADDPLSQEMMSPETTRQIILATAHLGNWELAGGTHSVLTQIPMTSIMRPLANKKIGDYIYSHRASFDHKTVSKEMGLRPLLKAHKEGDNITIVADQHANRNEGVEVTFFGHPARAHATPALLQLRTGTPIAMPSLIRKDDRFHFEFFISGIFVHEPSGDKDRDIREIVQKYTDNIEKAIRKHPDQWLWAHRRWLDCGRGPYPPPPEPAEPTPSAAES